MSLLGPLMTLRVVAGLAGLDPTILGHDSEVEITSVPLQYVEARHGETVVRGRPWVPHRRVATIARGTRLAVRGTVESRDDKGCRGKPWYAVWPFGFVCSEHVRASKRPPAEGEALPPEPGRKLPYRYAFVRHAAVPGFKSVESMRTGIVDKLFTKGMSLVISDTIRHNGTTYHVTRDGFVVPKDGVHPRGDGSAWAGVRIINAEPGPLLAWARNDGVPVYDGPGGDAERVAELDERERVWIYESDERRRRISTQDGHEGWVDTRALNEVVILEPPEDVVTPERLETTGNDQWLDIDTGEQVLVAYRGTRPVFATLIASGLRDPTPLGTYPVWAKVASIDMNNQSYEDNAYLVQGVPWVLLFQGHNALHGAYWHDRFGRRKSHGCVNLAPRDARWVFEWVGPAMPSGWTGYLPAKLEHAPVVRVRDSSAREGATFTQQRPWGPPDREAERKKADEAAERRAEEEATLADAFDSPASLFDDDAGGIPMLRR